MGKKDSKDLKKQAKNIQIVVTSDNEVEEDSNEEVPEIKVVKKKTSKCLAFDDKIDKVEYSVDGDAFHQVKSQFCIQLVIKATVYFTITIKIISWCIIENIE